MNKNLVALLLLLCLVIGCTNAPTGLRQPKGKVIGTVNQDRITNAELDYAAEQFRAEVSPTNLPKILDRMVSVILLSQEAVRRGLLNEEDVVAGLAWMERMYLANEIANRMAETVAPTAAEIADYFQRYRDQFTWGLKMMLMVLPDSVTAEATLTELKAGANFVKLARERSMDTSVINIPGYPTRGVGFSLGWSLKDEEQVFALNPGEISSVIATPVGYQIVKVVEKKRVTENPSFNEMTQFYINEALKVEKRRTAMDSLLNNLREKAKITLKPEDYQKR